MWPKSASAARAGRRRVTWSTVGSSRLGALLVRGAQSYKPPMQRSYLGDALDFWKGALLALLRASSEGRRVVKLLPMFTDAGWDSDACDTYTHLLGATRSDLLADDRL